MSVRSNIFAIMKTLTLKIIKVNVYNEVAKTTSYTGAKKLDDESAYDRIFTTDADRLMLERFWNEACGMANDTLKPFLVKTSDNAPGHCIDLSLDYDVTLSMPQRFDDGLRPAIESDLFSFFTNYIVSKWYGFTAKDEVPAYSAEAATSLKSFKKKIYFKKRPERSSTNL